MKRLRLRDGQYIEPEVLVGSRVQRVAAGYIDTRCAWGVDNLVWKRVLHTGVLFFAKDDE